MAIATLGAVLERRVWVTTLGRPLYPNLYVVLVADAGLGKSTAMTESKILLEKIGDASHKFHIGPDSVSGASLIDCMDDAKRVVDGQPDLPQYNTMFLMSDELKVLMSKWDEALVGMLTKFYDGNSFKEAKRRETIRHDIQKPNLSILCGSTPSNLMETIPPNSWNQGLTSRIILIFTNEKEHKVMLNGERVVPDDSHLVHDLNYFNQRVYGEIQWSDKYSDLFEAWRHPSNDCKPRPKHPKLKDYCSRRQTHLLKLSMIAAMDTGSMILREEHYKTAYGWLYEAEKTMEDLFTTGRTSADAGHMDEIQNLVRRFGRPVHHGQLVNYAIRAGVPASSILKVLEVMWASGKLEKDKENFYTAKD